MLSSLLTVGGLGLLLFAHPALGGTSVKLDLEDHATAASTTVDPHFVSFTSDWWTNEPAWGPGTSILNMDLESPKLRAAAAALVPAIWRIGGTRAEEAWYNMKDFNVDGVTTGGGGGSNNNSTDPTTPSVDDMSNTTNANNTGVDDTVIDDTNSTTMTNETNPTLPPPTIDMGNITDNNVTGTDDDNNSTLRYLQAFGEEGDPEAPLCQPDFCLSGTRWYQILQFAYQTGVKIVFTINYSMHTQTSYNDKTTRDHQDWDSTQARSLLEFTKQHAPPGVIFGFELGNEVSHENRITNFPRLGQAYGVLKDLIDEIWSDTVPPQRPKLLGPAATSSSYGEIVPYVESHVDIVTFHKYQSSGKSDTLESDALQPGFFWPPSKYSFEVSFANEAPFVWIGEGGMASNSGLEGVTDTFTSTLWMTNALGSMAQTHPVPISTFCRQTLIGGHYGLLDPDTLDPYPDFYMMRLWTQIMGNQAVGPVGVSSPQKSDSLLVHAFCGKETAQVVVVLVNIDQYTQYDVQINWGTKREEYRLEGIPDVRGKQVQINGVIQTMGENGNLPDMTPTTVQSASYETTPLTLPPYAIAFAVVHDSSVALCGGNPRIRPEGDNDTAKETPYTPDDLSTAALGVIIAASVVVCFLGMVACCCCKRRDVRKRNPHSMLSQDDVGDGLIMEESPHMNIPAGDNDDGLL